MNSHQHPPIDNESSDFGKLISTGAPVIDKSLLIKSIIMPDNCYFSAAAFLYPPGCGKSFNLSMLRHFFAASVNGKPTKDLFSHLKINKFSECMKHQGQYSVIYLDFNHVKAMSVNELQSALHKKMAALYREHDYLLEGDYLNKPQKRDFKEILDTTQFSRGLADLGGLEYSLLHLTEYIETYNKKTKITESARPWKFQCPLVIIDGYDSLISYPYDIRRDKGANLVSRFFAHGLSGNCALGTAFLSGTKRVFELLSYCLDYTLEDNTYSHYFGLTLPEIRELLNANNLPELLADEMTPDFHYLETRYPCEPEDEKMKKKGFKKIENTDNGYIRETGPGFNPEHVFDFIKQKLEEKTHANPAATSAWQRENLFQPSQVDTSKDYVCSRKHM